MLLSCGDALIDFVPAKSIDGKDAYVPAVGGSCLNVATAMARLGAPTGFVGGISTDLFGKLIAEHLAASNVVLDYATRPDLETTCAFVKLVNGAAQYAFYDEGTASRTWTYAPGAIPFDKITALHVGSTTLINDPCASAYEALVRAAQPQCIISFDPNVRPTLTKDIVPYRARMNRLRRWPTLSACRTRILNFCMKTMIMTVPPPNGCRTGPVWCSSPVAVTACWPIWRQAKPKRRPSR